MRTNIVLIDYENVQPTDLAELAAEYFRVLVFVGVNQPKVPVKLARALLEKNNLSGLVEICGSGKNALDFHMAFYIGHLALEEETAFFHIISKDSGFDPLIEHLKVEKKISVIRSASIGDIPLVKRGKTTGSTERLAMVVEDLGKRKEARPGSRKALAGTIAGFFQKTLSEGEVAALIEEMERRKVIAFQGEKVRYSLPEEGVA
jgi:hypothetical protein